MRGGAAWFSPPVFRETIATSVAITESSAETPSTPSVRATKIRASRRGGAPQTVGQGVGVEAFVEAFARLSQHGTQTAIRVRACNSHGRRGSIPPRPGPPRGPAQARRSARRAPACEPRAAFHASDRLHDPQRREFLHDLVQMIPGQAAKRLRQGFDIDGVLGRPWPSRNQDAKGEVVEARSRMLGPEAALTIPD